MINLTVVIDNDEALKKLKELQNVAKSTTSSVVKDSERMDASFDKLKNTLAGLTAGVSFAALARQVVQIRGEVQQLEVAFETMLGSKERAEALMTEVIDLAAKTPFGLQDVSNATKMLLAYGSTAESVAEEIKMLGNIASGLSIPLNDMIYLYGTTRTQGRMFTQDLRQFMGRGIPLAEELAKQFGVTKDKVGELVTAGKVGFDEMAKALQAMTSEGGQFNNLMDKQSQTIAGQISNLEDAIYQMFNEIGRANEGVISGAVDIASSLVENYERVGRILASLVVTYGVYRTAMMLAAATAKGYTIAELAHYGALVAVEKAQRLLNATMLTNPYVLAATAIAGVVALLVSQKNATERLREAEEKYAEEKNKIIAAEEEHQRIIAELTSIAGDDAAATDLRKDALHKLIREYPEVFAKYETEAEMLKNILEIKKEIDKIEKGRSITTPENELADVERRIKGIIDNPNWKDPESDYAYYTKDQEAELQQLRNRRAELQKQIRDERRQAYLQNAPSLTDKELNDEIALLKKAQDLIKMRDAALKTSGSMMQGVAYGQELINLGLGDYDEQQLQAELKILEAERAARDADKKSVADWVEAKRKAYEAAQKAYDDYIKNNKGKVSEEEFTKESQRLKENADIAKKEYDKYKTSAKDSKTAKERAEASRQLQNAVDQAEIEAMAEGTNKKIAQIKLDYELRRQEIERQKADLIAKQGKPLTAEQSASFDTLHASNKMQATSEWEQYVEEQVEAAGAILRAEQEALKAEETVWNEYLMKYGTFQEKVKATTEEYAKAIANAKNEAERKTLEAERDAILAEYEVEASSWAQELVNMSTNALNKMLIDLNAQVEAKQAAFDVLGSSDSKEAKNYQKEIAHLKAQIKALQDELNKAGRAAKSDNWADATQVFQNISDAANNAAEGIAEFDESIADALRTLAQFASSAINMIGAIQGVIKAFDTGVGALEKSSAILAILGAAIQAVSMLVSAFKGANEVEETMRQFEDLNEELVRFRKLAQIDSVEGTIFGKDVFANFTNNLRVTQERLDDLNKSMDAIANRTYKVKVAVGIDADTGEAIEKEIEATYGDFEESLRNMSVLLQNKTWFRARKTSTLEEQYPELFNGELSLEGLKKLRDSDVWDKLSATNRKLIENMIADWEAYDKTLESVNNYMKDIFGNVGESISNSLVDAFENGTDAAENMAESIGEIMEQLAIQMAYTALLQPIMEEAEKRINELNANKEDMSEEEYWRGLMDIVGDTISEAKNAQDAWNILIGNMKEMAAAEGVEMFGGDTESQRATSGGFQTMSQETGSELNGRFTDIQGQTHRIAEAVEFCRALSASNLATVQSINATVASIHNDTSLIEKHTRALGQMSKDLSDIKTAVFDGAI